MSLKNATGLPPPLLWTVPPAVTPTDIEPLSPPKGTDTDRKAGSLPPVSPDLVVRLPELPGIKQEQPWPAADWIAGGEFSDLDQFEFLEPIRPELCVDELPEEIEKELEAQKRKRRIKNTPINPSLPKAKRRKLNRMRKNRESAQKSREKKARHRAMLNEQVRMLERKNGQLRKAISLLTDQATEAQNLRVSNEALLQELQAAQEEHERLQELAEAGPAAAHTNTINITNISATNLPSATLGDNSTKVEPKPEPPAPAANAFPGMNGIIMGLESLGKSVSFNSAYNTLSAASNLLAGSPKAQFSLFNDLLLENQQRLMPHMRAFDLPPIPTLMAPMFPQPGALASPRIHLPPIEMS